MKKARIAKMDNREKTIDAFEKCIKLDDEGKLYSDCEHCPYKSEERKLKGEAACESFVDLDVQIPYQLAAEMLELVKSQEPKVITREGLKQFDERPCWFESHGTYMGEKGFWIIPYMFTCYETMYYVYPLMQINDRGDCHYSELGLSAYNKAWRCWSSRPTDEQRKAAKWND